MQNDPLQLVPPFLHPYPPLDPHDDGSGEFAHGWMEEEARKIEPYRHTVLHSKFGNGYGHNMSPLRHSGKWSICGWMEEGGRREGLELIYTSNTGDGLPYCLYLCNEGGIWTRACPSQQVCDQSIEIPRSIGRVDDAVMDGWSESKGWGKGLYRRR